MILTTSGSMSWRGIGRWTICGPPGSGARSKGGSGGSVSAADFTLPSSFRMYLRTMGSGVPRSSAGAVSLPASRGSLAHGQARRGFEPVEIRFGVVDVRGDADPPVAERRHDALPGQRPVDEVGSGGS